MWYEEHQSKIREYFIQFKKVVGYEGNLEPSWAYNFKKHYTDNQQYPNAGYPGVYIFVTPNEVLNIGKSINAVGGELHRDVKGWVLKLMDEENKDIAVITVHVPDISFNDYQDLPYELEKFLIEVFNPTQQY